jgi:hypothetical protein
MGYKNLNIDIFLSAATLFPYINITYDKKEKKADDIHKKLNDLFKNSKVLTLYRFQSAPQIWKISKNY